MSFIQSILDNPNSIVDYPIIDNPQLDNLESLPLSDRVYMLYSYLMATDSGSLDKMRLRLFKSELEFLKLVNKPIPNVRSDVWEMSPNTLSNLERKKIILKEAWDKLH